MNVVTLVLILIVLVVVVFFFVQIQKTIMSVLLKIGNAIGIKTQGLEYSIQRYMFSNTESIIAKLYRWVNVQVICLGLKQYGVTVVGFLAFWAIVAAPLTIVLSLVAKMSIFITPVIYLLIISVLLFITRMRTDSLVEEREGTIMDTVDLLIPDIGSGVQNCISKYMDVIPEAIHMDFSQFLDRIVNKGYSFEASMTILSDNIGNNVFYDFAQKAIFYERQGDKDMIEIFSDIVETNRLRRELREENRIIFNQQKQDFLISSAMVWGYALFIGMKEEFTREFLLHSTLGQIILIIDILIEIIVLAIITSIRSKEL